MSPISLMVRLGRLRAMLAFNHDTAVPGTGSTCRSAGHCAAVAVIVYTEFGGQFVSAVVDGQSHWFNRIHDLDVDLTGDQFGFAAVRAEPSGRLFPASRIRDASELNDETVARALLLARRSGLRWDDL